MNLITDRTEMDYKAALELSKIPWRKMNEGQKAQWRGTMRGRYAAMDLNRVEEAVEALAMKMVEIPAEIDEEANAIGVDWDRGQLPYDPEEEINLTVKTDWTAADMMSFEERERYMKNVAFFRDIFAPDAPLPFSLDYLTLEGANEIEAVLLAADNALESLREEILKGIHAEGEMLKFHSGEIYSNEVRV